MEVAPGLPRRLHPSSVATPPITSTLDVGLILPILQTGNGELT